MLLGHVNNAQAIVQVEDDLGRTIKLDTPARSIVSLYGSYNEILFEMGLGSLVVARTNSDTVPTEILKLPSIGTHMRPNLELIVGMEPDLVLQMGGRSEAVQSVYDLEHLGITTAFFSVSSFDDLFRVVQKLGVLVGDVEAAADLVQKMRERLNFVDMAISMNRDRPTVFFEVRSPKLLTAGKASIVSEIITKAGGRNCIQNDGKLVRINDEELFRISPDFYILQQGPMNSVPVPMPERPRLSRLQAVINNHWHVVEEQIFSRPGPRNIRAVEQLARLLHPDAFENQ